jgi:RNA polymerase sigma factor (TIGR02999 family)
VTPATRIIVAAEQGDPHAAEELLPLVYAELRRLAAQRLSDERPGQTLQATALVHEAYLRLAGKQLAFDGPRHFLFAAARAMHDILVERARRKASLKQGGGRARLDLESLEIAYETPSAEILALADAMSALAAAHPRKHQVASLRFFAGCTTEQAAAALDVSPATVAREWRFARAWLHERLSNSAASSSPS